MTTRKTRRRRSSLKVASSEPSVDSGTGIMGLLGGLATDATYGSGRRRRRCRHGAWQRIEVRHNEIDVVSTGGCDTLIIQNISIRVKGRKLIIEGKR